MIQKTTINNGKLKFVFCQGLKEDVTEVLLNIHEERDSTKSDSNNQYFYLNIYSDPKLTDQNKKAVVDELVSP